MTPLMSQLYGSSQGTARADLLACSSAVKEVRLHPKTPFCKIWDHNIPIVFGAALRFHYPMLDIRHSSGEIDVSRLWVGIFRESSLHGNFQN